MADLDPDQRQHAKAAPFCLHGEVTPIMGVRLEKGGEGWRPTRPLGGWLAVYGHIGPRGGIIPTVDRDGQTFDAVRTLGMIDFSEYISAGKWNDSHNKPNGKDSRTIVGTPTLLEYHDETSELAKAHGKVGFWTEGHLFDRDDPFSWTLLGRHEPTTFELDRADHFWRLATLLKGTPRSLGLSADGVMVESRCKQRILKAWIKQAAVCEMPRGPDAAVVPLELASRITPDMAIAQPCATCNCPPGMRCATTPLAKAMRRAPADSPSLSLPTDPPPEFGLRDRIDRLTRQLARKHGITEEQARAWIRKELLMRGKPAPEDAHGK